jgi:hypothetical protein
MMISGLLAGLVEYQSLLALIRQALPLIASILVPMAN